MEQNTKISPDTLDFENRATGSPQPHVEPASAHIIKPKKSLRP